MQWNWLDVVIVLMALAEMALIGYIVVVVLRIRNGAVTRVSDLLLRNFDSGKRIVETGTAIGKQSLPYLVRSQAVSRKMLQSFKPVVLDDEPITYASITRISVNVRAVTGGYREVRALFRRVSRDQAAASATGRPMPVPLAERLGLVPPAWKRLSPYLRHARTVQSVIKAVRKQLK